MPPANRVFTDQELADFSKDCMKLAMEALERGDVEAAKRWIRRQDETKDVIHDLYLHWITALLSHVYDRWGEDEAVRSVRDTARNFSLPLLKQKTEMIREQGVRAWVEAIVDIWRQHSMYPGMKIEEDDEKFVFTLNPCGSGGRLIDMRAYEGPFAYRKLRKPGPHTWGEKDMPIYCSHCPWVHEIFPLAEGGAGSQFWIHASPFPKKPGDPCIHYVYKDPEKIPDRYYDRIEMTREPRRLPRSHGLEPEQSGK
ncbi:MAG: PhoU domain-containing protein [Deltaproteobacteria bacterium]|nr:PhoU domain-containing protein [Deltaproteobacteria bacterium]